VAGRKRPAERQHPKVYRRWELLLGIWSSRSKNAAGSDSKHNLLSRTTRDTTILSREGYFFFDLDEDAKELYIVDQKRVLVYDYGQRQHSSAAGAATA